MSACERLETDLTNEEALGILSPYAEATREAFLEEGFDKVRRVEFSVSRAMHDTPRHFAACETSGRRILVAPELAELDEQFVRGIIAHEFGHAVDFLYPAEFALGGGRAGLTRRLRERETDTQWIRFSKEWDKRSDDVVEQTADRIAELVWRKPIGYAGPCLLQNFEAGARRPEGLR